jgi:NADP-dependent 3-hydroxy acid dehydrogenase YdfG
MQFCPGVVATEFIDNITDSAAKQVLEARFKAVTPLQPEDIARAITYAVTQPSHVNVNEILIQPTQQE